MSDLDKMMAKLQADKEEVAKVPQETEGLKNPVEEAHAEAGDLGGEVAETPAQNNIPTTEEIEEDDSDQEIFDDPEEVAETPKVTETEDIADAPKVTETPKVAENTIEHEVGLLQNDGVFRRELILTLKELVDVHKVNTQTLIDIKKAVIGGKHAQKTTN